MDSQISLQSPSVAVNHCSLEEEKKKEKEGKAEGEKGSKVRDFICQAVFGKTKKVCVCVCMRVALNRLFEVSIGVGGWLFERGLFRG